jgi:hypothetical protein
MDEVYLENDWVSWKDIIPKNESQYKITESHLECPVWENLSSFEKACAIQKAIRLDGVVMLLPGQQLENCQWISRSHPIHLNRKRAEKIVQLAELEETEEYKNWERLVDQLLIKDFPKLYLVSNQPNAPGATSLHFNKPSGFLALFSLLYGAIYASAWGDKFPTNEERILWQISVCIVGFGGLVVWCLLEIFQRGGHVSRDIAGLLIGVFVVVWSAARMFLILEAVTSLRDLPDEATDAISWLNWWPLITSF